jgi:hypothetical protein
MEGRPGNEEGLKGKFGKRLDRHAVSALRHPQALGDDRRFRGVQLPRMEVPTMKSLPTAAATGILLGFFLGCQSSGPVAEGTRETVRALRYKRNAFESMLEFSHGAGTWYEEMYFPEKGIVSTLGWTSSWDEKEEELELKYKPKLYAYYGDIQNKFAVSFNNEIEQTTEEIQVPEDLAKRIFALAALQKKLGEEQELLGGVTEKAGVLRMNVEPPPEQK